MAGAQRVAGRLVDLGRITCPVLTIAAERDTICPPAAALALNTHCGSADVEELVVPGGHVGAVVGSRAASMLYPNVSLSSKRAAASANLSARHSRCSNSGTAGRSSNRLIRLTYFTRTLRFASAIVTGLRR